MGNVKIKFLISWCPRPCVSWLLGGAGWLVIALAQWNAELLVTWLLRLVSLVGLGTLNSKPPTVAQNSDADQREMLRKETHNMAHILSEAWSSSVRFRCIKCISPTCDPCYLVRHLPMVCWFLFCESFLFHAFSFLFACLPLFACSWRNIPSMLSVGPRC